MIILINNILTNIINFLLKAAYQAPSSTHPAVQKFLEYHHMMVVHSQSTQVFLQLYSILMLARLAWLLPSQFLLLLLHLSSLQFKPKLHLIKRCLCFRVIQHTIPILWVQREQEWIHLTLDCKLPLQPYSILEQLMSCYPLSSFA